MFQLVLDGSPRQLTLSGRDHALINASMADVIAKVFQDHDWTCHVCGVRLEGLMEIDHLKGHRPCEAASVASICQFCHDLRHPMWAMSRKRAFPVYAPDIPQAALSRFAWTLLSEMTRTNGEEMFEGLIDAIAERESAAFEMLDGENMESALEAILVLKGRSGAHIAAKACRELDAQIRFLPSCVRDGQPLLRWTSAGFRPVPIDILHRAFGPEPDFEKLSRAASELIRT
jgi:hypothetical protein